MRSSIVEPRPPENAEFRGTYTSFQPAFRSPLSDPQLQNTQSASMSNHEHHSLTPGEGWLAMLLLAIAVYSVVFSIIFSNWVSYSYILLFSTAIGLLLGLCVAKIQWFPQAILHLAAVLLGHWISVWLVSTFAYHTSWLALLENLRLVINGGFTSTAASSSEMVFLFYLTFLSFFLAYFGAWLIYRARLPWLVALVYCSIMLVNLNYGKQNLIFLMIIMLAALILLIVRIHLVNQLTQWTSEGLYIDRVWLRNITRRFIQIGALFTLLILLISLVLPIVSQPNSGANLWNKLDNMWTNISHGQITLTNPGSLLQPYQPPANFFGDQLPISGNVNLPAGEVLSYTNTTSSKPQPYYLEGFTFDHFDGHTWTSTNSNVPTSYDANTSYPLEATDSNKQVNTTVTIVKPPDGAKQYLFAPAQPVSFSVPTTLYGNENNITAWTQQNPISSGESYQVVSRISTATDQQLSNVQSPPDNPGLWSNFDKSYLQVPPDLSAFPVVRNTLKQWTSGSTNVYNSMKALESHLKDQTQFTYSVSNPPVPSNVDAVAWLLQTRQGYCTYYASTMVVMARMSGIPARIVNGFSQGNLQGNRWVVNGEDAHSWVQVYFPSYGWINFDPTPGFSATASPTPKQNTAPAQTQPSARATPIATTTHQTPKTRSTPKTGLTGTSANTTSSAAILRQNLFLTLSLLILCCSLVVFGIALLYRVKIYKLSAAITASIVYRRVCRLAAMFGTPPKRWQTPYEYYWMIARRFPRVAAPMSRLTELFVRERWAAPHQLPSPAEEQTLQKLWPQLRNTLIHSFFSRKNS